MQFIMKEDNRNLFLFLLISFLFSWILWLPSIMESFGVLQPTPLYSFLRIIGSFGPFIGAFTLTSVNEGLEGIKLLWTRGWHYGNW